MKSLRCIKIGNRRIGDNYPVFIIAEAGVNHNGEEKIAFKMIDEAVKTGADAIKFQTFITEETVSRNAPFAEHHIANVKNKKSHFELIKRLELPFTAFARLKNYAKKSGIMFISTPYDIISAKYLASIKVPAIKIASAEISNAPLLDAVIEAGLPIILSTGMNDFDTIVMAANKILKKGLDLAILKCTSNYPVEYSNINLNGIGTLKKRFKNCVIGFSDHSEGFEAACAAVTLGAKIIEKHFTLDKNMWGPDHKASFDIKELAKLVKTVRNTELALGSSAIRVLDSETNQKYSMQKSIYARRDIPEGKTISLDDLIFLRPAGGIPPLEHKKIVGKKTKVNIKKEAIFKREFLN